MTGNTQQAAIGRHVLKNLEQGRDAVNATRKAQGDFHRRIIAEYLLLDLQAGGVRWGRGGRIQRQLKGRLSVRQVNKILVLLASSSQPVGHTALTTTLQRRAP